MATRSEQYADKEMAHLRVYWTTPDGKLEVPEDRLRTALQSAYLSGAMEIIEEANLKPVPTVEDFPGITQP